MSQRRSVFTLARAGDADAHCARGDLADVHDQAGDGAARIGDSHGPRGLLGRVDDHAGVADLTAALDVERRGREDDLDLLPGDRSVDQQPVGDDRNYLGLGLGGHQVDGVDAAGWQLVKHAHVDRKILALDTAKLGRCAGALALRLQRITVAGHVDGQPVLFGDIARQVQREAVGIPQAEGLGAGKNRLIVRLDRVDHAFEQVQAHVEGAQEALLLVLDRAQNDLLALAQLGVGVAHRVDHRAADARQERLGKAEQPAVACGAAQHQAQDVIASFVPRQHAVGDQEGDRAGVVGDDAVGNHVGGHLLVGVVEQLLHAQHDWPEQIGVVVGAGTLDHRYEPFEAHAGIHAWLRKKRPGAVGGLVVLHEHQVPHLQPAAAAVVQATLQLGRPHVQAAAPQS